MPITFENTRPAPQAIDFTPLASHDAKTPATFFGGRPVLYNHSNRCDVTVKSAPTSVIRQWLGSGTSNEYGQREQSSPSETAITKENINVFVTSESLILFWESVVDSTTSQDAGAATLDIPYPAISLHATQRLWKTSKQSVAGASESNSELLQSGSGLGPTSTYTVTQDDSPDAQLMSAVYLQLDPSHHLRATMNPNEDDLSDADDTVELLLIPQDEKPEADMNGADGAIYGDGNAPTSAAVPTPNQGAVTALFEALSRCADLHPDPDDEGEDEEMDDDVGPAPALGDISGMTGFPGEGGWITSENAHEFEGQFAVDVEETEDGVILGPGAGTRRARDSDHGDAADGEARNGQQEDADGEEPGDGQTKWQRTN
ncbi:MAG: hypothetical protein M1831_002430 [Alyxoria varia]|nr:MAG: hypothetical protein M1831_002430 [Alyxoria varia]